MDSQEVTARKRQEWIIQRRIDQIDAEISALKAQRAELMRVKSAAWAEDGLREGEVLNMRNAQKFELLGKIKMYLRSQPRKDGSFGRTTGEVRNHLESTYRMKLKDATLRSHLHRFKEEERLAYDEESKLWTIIEQEALF